MRQPEIATAGPEIAQRHSGPLRKLVTRRGAFILPWRPPEVKFLLRSEHLAPADLAVGDEASDRALARDLFLLGLQDEMASDLFEPGPSPISRVARGILGLMRDRRG